MPFIAEEIPAFHALDDVRTFVTAGRATFTLVSNKTGNRFTYKVTKFVPEGQEPEQGRTMWFVKVLTGPENTTDYEFIGTIFPGTVYRPGYRYVHSAKKARIHQHAPSVQAIAWFVNTVLNGDVLNPNVEVYHAGSCGRCGRTLTVPESIKSGFGPECIGRL